MRYVFYSCNWQSYAVNHSILWFYNVTGIDMWAFLRENLPILCSEQVKEESVLKKQTIVTVVFNFLFWEKKTTLIFIKNQKNTFCATYQPPSAQLVLSRVVVKMSLLIWAHGHNCILCAETEVCLWTDAVIVWLSGMFLGGSRESLMDPQESRQTQDYVFVSFLHLYYYYQFI